MIRVKQVGHYLGPFLGPCPLLVFFLFQVEIVHMRWKVLEGAVITART